MKALLFVLAILVMSHVQGRDVLPDRGARKAILHELVDKIERYDGEALFVRRNRVDSWQDTTAQLVAEGTRARTLNDFVRSLQRIDQAYPNLHSSFRVQDEEIAEGLPNRVIPGVRFAETRPSAHQVQFVISQVDQEFPEDFVPRVGDVLLAINGRSMQSWLDEQFSFCKWPHKSQCGLTMFRNFTREYLSWRRTDGLSYTVSRNGTVHEFEVDLLDYQASSGRRSKYRCADFSDRYEEFEMVYAGNRACVFESEDYPDTAILRITSFAYNRGRNENPPVCAGDQSLKIEDIADEVECLRKTYWGNAGRWKHLIVDVLDNGGGQSPIPYYQIMFTKPFQEQWVMFRKNDILEDEELRNGIFWGSQGQELWYQKIRQNGVWDATARNDFLPKLPMFCADESNPCDETRFEPSDHQFRGHVTLLVNELCVSSCDGFVYELKDELKDAVKIIGIPQAADTAYSRVALDVYGTPRDGEYIKMRSIYSQVPTGVLFTQTVAVSRSVAEDGRVVSGIPEGVDQFVPYSFEERARYADKALKVALSYW